ncbi:MAG TPA: hypothetical protein VE154_07620 [Chthoniobacterales bacterium]|jgi:hypothetical protein|nr:hypothetical protein [Chthoniobacterales bacterium]
MQDRVVMMKMVVATLAGLLAYVTAIFTTVLDLSILWRNIWLGFCLVFFVIALTAVFYLCGDLNSDHSVPDEQKSKER